MLCNCRKRQLSACISLEERYNSSRTLTDHLENVLRYPHVKSVVSSLLSVASGSLPCTPTCASNVKSKYLVYASLTPRCHKKTAGPIRASHAGSNYKPKEP